MNTNFIYNFKKNGLKDTYKMDLDVFNLSIGDKITLNGSTYSILDKVTSINNNGVDFIIETDYILS